MALTAAQLEARAGKLTASVVGYLMSGSRAKIINIWRELIGDPDYVRDNLDDVWPVQLGSVTEQLNLDWYERKTGHEVTRRGEVVAHPTCDWAAATLDGFDAVEGIPIECKHVGGFEPLQTILDRYRPQCHWQMDALVVPRCVMSIIVGAKEPTRKIVEYDESYAAELWRRAESFMTCVRTLTPPS